MTGIRMLADAIRNRVQSLSHQRKRHNLVGFCSVCVGRRSTRIMVGDMDSDREFAAGLGIRFQWANDFFE